MHRSIVFSAAALLTSAMFASDARAQVLPSADLAPANRLFEVTPYAGYMMFGDYLRGPLGTSIGPSSAPVIGAQLGVRVTDNISVVGNVARAAGDLRVGAPIIGGIGVGNSTVMMYDAGLQLRSPLGARSALPITPFVQVGAGAMTHDVSASILSARSTNVAFNAGIGADVAIGDNVGLRLMAKDYIGRFDTQEASGINYEGQLAHNWKVGAGLTLRF